MIRKEMEKKIIVQEQSIITLTNVINELLAIIKQKDAEIKKLQEIGDK